MRLLVTGGTGALGRHVVHGLRSSGHHAVVLVAPDDAAGARWAQQHKYVFTRGDVCDRSAVQSALRGCDAVVHLAGVAGVRADDAAAMWRVNVGGARVVATACHAAGLRLVHLSSCSAVGLGPTNEPVTESSDFAALDLRHAYPLSKRAGQEVVTGLADRGLDAAVLNPAAVLAPGDPHANAWSSLPRLVRQGMAWVPPGGFAFAHRQTLQDAIAAALCGGADSRPTLVVDESASYQRLCTLVAKALGRPGPRRLPARVTDAGLTALGLARRLPALAARFPLDRRVAPFLIWPNRFDGSAGRARLGLTTRTLADCVADLVRPGGTPE